jgi:hypothetical protein
MQLIIAKDLEYANRLLIPQTERLGLSARCTSVHVQIVHVRALLSDDDCIVTWSRGCSQRTHEFQDQAGITTKECGATQFPWNFPRIFEERHKIFQEKMEYLQNTRLSLQAKSKEKAEKLCTAVGLSNE